MHRETVASTKRENPSLLESSSGGSGNSSSNQSFTNASENEVHWNEERNPSRRQILGLKFLDDRNEEDTPLILSSSSTYGSRPWWKWKKKCAHTHLTRRGERNAFGGCRTSGIVEKIPKLIGEEFKYEDWLHCLYRRRFKTRFEICKHEDGELSEIRAIRRHSAEIIIHSRPMNYVMIHHTRRVTHTEEGVTQRRGDTHREYPHSFYILREHTHSADVCGANTKSIFCCRSCIGGRRRRKRRKS